MPAVSDAPLIYHSDRGIQYCCNAYVKELNKHKVSISMTEENHCYENSLAERVNGILKDEFLLDSTFKDYNKTLRAVKEAITTYNQLRPHWSLDLKTPSDVHFKSAALKILFKQEEKDKIKKSINCQISVYLF